MPQPEDPVARPAPAARHPSQDYSDSDEDEDESAEGVYPMVSPRGNVFAPYHQDSAVQDPNGAYAQLLAAREKARNDQQAAKVQTYHVASTQANDQAYGAAVEAHAQQYYHQGGYPGVAQAAYYYPGPVEAKMASQVGPTGFRGYGRTATGIPASVQAAQNQWVSQTLQQQYGAGRDFSTPFEPVQTYRTYY